MKAQHLGVREVARRARLDPSFFSKILAGKRSPPSDDRMLERLAVCLEMSPTALYVYAGRIPPACQAAFETPRSRAARGAGAVPGAWSPAIVARPPASESRTNARTASPIVARSVEPRNAWDTTRPVKPRAGAGEASRAGRAASGTPPKISDDLL